jgi:hypothetical protein
MPGSNQELGTWVGSQRGKKHSLSQDRIDRLNAINFSWDVREALREENFQQLQEFHKENGHCNVPYNNSEPTTC